MHTFNSTTKNSRSLQVLVFLYGDNKTCLFCLRLVGFIRKPTPYILHSLPLTILLHLIFFSCLYYLFEVWWPLTELSGLWFTPFRQMTEWILGVLHAFGQHQQIKVVTGNRVIEYFLVWSPPSEGPMNKWRCTSLTEPWCWRALGWIWLVP